MFKKLSSKIRPTYIFNIFAIFLIVISILMGKMYKETTEEVVAINHSANIDYLQSLRHNLELDITRIIQKDFLNSLQSDTIAREYVESNLKLFVTTKYRYIYLVAKPFNTDNSFVYLTDNEHGEQYDTLEKENYEKAWNSKKSIYFQHENKQNLCGTYISPIIVENRVEALLVIQFSLQEQDTILFVLNSLGDLFSTLFGFFVVIFIFMLWFSFLDKQHEEQKNIVFEELQKSNAILNETTSKLKIESNKIKYLNDSLEKRVKKEVQKNRVKDVQLMHQARLAQMGEMLSMIAHQWRQPLSAISSTSTSINLKAKLNKLDKEYIIKNTNNISDYVQHLSETIDDFRNFFRPNKEKIDTNYRDLIDSVDKLIATSLADKKIDFTKEIECSETLFTYPNELKHVILNLIKNAEDVLLEKKIKNPYIQLHTYSDMNDCILEVKDNGGGIDDAILENIFDPYFSTKLEKDGTGLGLYMSKIIVEEHCDGRLSARSDAQGAIFKIIVGKKNA